MTWKFQNFQKPQIAVASTVTWLWHAWKFASTKVCKSALKGRFLTQFHVIQNFVTTLRSALFWDFTQHRVVVPYQCFGTAYRSHLEDGINRLSWNIGWNFHCMLCKISKSADLILWWKLKILLCLCWHCLYFSLRSS